MKTFKSMTITALIAMISLAQAQAQERDIDASIGFNEGGAALAVTTSASNDENQKIGMGFELGKTRRLRANLAPFQDVHKRDYEKHNVRINVLGLDWVASAHHDGDSSRSLSLALARITRTGEIQLRNDMQLRTQLIGAIVGLEQRIEQGEKDLKARGLGAEAVATAALRKRLDRMTTAELLLTAKFIDTFNGRSDPTGELGGEFLLHRDSGVYTGIKATSSSFGIDGTREKNSFIGATVGKAF